MGHSSLLYLKLEVEGLQSISWKSYDREILSINRTFPNHFHSAIHWSFKYSFFYSESDIYIKLFHFLNYSTSIYIKLFHFLKLFSYSSEVKYVFLKLTYLFPMFRLTPPLGKRQKNKGFLFLIRRGQQDSFEKIM